MILLHYTGMRTGQAAEDWLCAEESQVSSHYLVHEDGRVVQIVREKDRAWHAGKSYWQGETDINSRSVGIEIVNPGHEFGYRPFPAVQIDAVIALCRGIALRRRIRPERVLAHSDVAPGRKVDPGELFPWARLAAAGVGHFVVPAPAGAGAGETTSATIAEARALLGEYGYDVTDVERTGTVVAAFQRHFRPERVDGVADASTLDTLRRLIAVLRQPMAGAGP
ncbi:MAG: N-acetylmuramoyl-L-alanine amidase [Rhizobiales bacterium]|nr:N-acetylmuramoyl-L-alanine amidase [Hyphomicrobiales bacterium]